LGENSEYGCLFFTNRFLPRLFLIFLSFLQIDSFHETLFIFPQHGNKVFKAPSSIPNLSSDEGLLNFNLDARSKELRKYSSQNFRNRKDLPFQEKDVNSALNNASFAT
jgi:hypothetical protein